ncbi:MAG: NusB antitermination factor [Acidimicrobiaceae bacterium]|nr:NusB antitermination factor [Acidimicrobiaceae bacterium]
MKDLAPEQVLASLPIPPEAYAEELFLGVGRRAAEVDRLVAENATSWAIDRMPAVDRQLLRLATYELLDRPDVPLAVIIDEAVELAKQYSTDDSGRYVNGVLAAVAARVRPGEAKSR